MSASFRLQIGRWQSLRRAKKPGCDGEEKENNFLLYLRQFRDPNHAIKMRFLAEFGELIAVKQAVRG